MTGGIPIPRLHLGLGKPLGQFRKGNYPSTGWQLRAAGPHRFWLYRGLRPPLWPGHTFLEEVGMVAMERQGDR